MTITIKTDNHGKDVIWSEVGGKTVPLPVENLFVRLADGHVFNLGGGAPGTRGANLSRLRPHEPEMVDHWLSNKDLPEPDIFSGEPPNE